MRRALVGFIVVAACGHGDQSLRDAIAVLCGAEDGPPVRDPAAVQAWLTEHIRNREGRDFVATVADLRPWMRGIQIRRAASEHEIEGCKPIAALAGVRSEHGVDVPALDGLESGVEPIDDTAPYISITPGELTVDAKPFGLAGLQSAAGAVRATLDERRSPIRFATVAAPRTTTCAALAPGFDVVRHAGASSVRVVVTIGDADRAVAIDLPRAHTGGDIAPMVSVGPSRIVTTGGPIELGAGRAALRDGLAKLDASSPTLLVICEPDATVDALASVAAAARASGRFQATMLAVRPPPLQSR